MSTILIGMPGSGKTTVINMYKKIYGEQVYDTDGFIESRHGNISNIFAEYGEEYFRKIETEAIREICSYGDDALIATGGGAVLRNENVRIFRKSGNIIYLRTKLETLLARLDGDASRPLLLGNRAERLTKLYSERTPVYESVADIIIDTDGYTPEEILKRILEVG